MSQDDFFTHTTSGRVETKIQYMKKCLLLTAVVFFGTFTAAIAQVPSYVPTDGLVGWWPFNSNANDESGNGNDGIVNGPTLTEDRNGNAEKAYSFGDNSITINNSNSLDFTPVQNVSI
jgi:hypothetical protein